MLLRNCYCKKSRKSEGVEYQIHNDRKAQTSNACRPVTIDARVVKRKANLPPCPFRFICAITLFVISLHETVTVQ